MPTRNIHVRKAQEWSIPKEVADIVSKLKDELAEHLPGHAHRGFNHGLGTNFKYFKKMWSLRYTSKHSS